MESTLFADCPGCRASALVVESAGRLACAACAFDYAAFAKRSPEFEAFLVSHLAGGPWKQLVAIDLHRRLSGMPVGASVQAVRALATKNGIALPSPANSTGAVRIALVVAVLVVIAIAAVLVVATRG